MVTTISPVIKWMIIIQTIVLSVLVFLFIYFSLFGVPGRKPITSYEECVAAQDSVIQESYPATCITKQKQRFTQPIDGIQTAPVEAPARN